MICSKQYHTHVPKLEWQIKCGFKPDPFLPLLTIETINPTSHAPSSLNPSPGGDHITIATPEGGTTTTQLPTSIQSFHRHHRSHTIQIRHHHQHTYNDYHHHR
jgi:hypothetical protein